MGSIKALLVAVVICLSIIGSSAMADAPPLTEGQVSTFLKNLDVVCEASSANSAATCSAIRSEMAELEKAKETDGTAKVAKKVLTEIAKKVLFGLGGPAGAIGKLTLVGQEIAGELYDVGGPGFTDEESTAIAFRELSTIRPATLKKMLKGRPEIADALLTALVRKKN